MNHCFYRIVWSLAFCLLLSCSYSKNFTNNYYRENETLLQSMKQRFKQLYEEHNFSLEIKDKSFKQVGLEIISDTLRYIYDFSIDDPSLIDTLYKYKFNASEIVSLINDMQKTHCTWITNLDYYEKQEKKFLVFISIRHRKLESVFKKDKYFTLAFFNSPQPFDKNGRLLDKKDHRQLRKINGAILFRINDKVGYALNDKFR